MEKTKKNRQLSDPEGWVDAHGDYLFRIALLRVQDRQLAEDMLQETFLSALKSYSQFKGKSSERTWFVSILKRKIIDYFRKNNRYVSLNVGEDSDVLPDFINQGEHRGRWKENYAPQSWGQNPLQAVEHSEFRKVFQNCISDLPVTMASVFKLKEIEQLKSEDICKELNITSSNLWVILHRARTQLRRCMEVNWFSANKTRDR